MIKNQPVLLFPSPIVRIRIVVDVVVIAILV
jgi:hypothetical protein